MPTDKQIAANQANARKCTGPRSIEGKKTSSQNALKTGLDAKSEVIRHESRADYEALIAEYYARFHPTSPEERCLVDTLIKAEWFGRRYTAVETAVWERDFSNSTSGSLGLAYIRQSDVLARVDRRINSAQRNFSSALKQLLALQAQEALGQAHPDVATKTLADELVSFRIVAREPPQSAENTLASHPEEQESPPIAA